MFPKMHRFWKLFYLFIFFSTIKDTIIISYLLKKIYYLRWVLFEIAGPRSNCQLSWHEWKASSYLTNQRLNTLLNLIIQLHCVLQNCTIDVICLSLHKLVFTRTSLNKTTEQVRNTVINKSTKKTGLGFVLSLGEVIDVSL